MLQSHANWRCSQSAWNESNSQEWPVAKSLYKALSGEGNPQFETIYLVLKALGLRLRAEPANDSKSAA
jgi:hypothetical protein